MINWFVKKVLGTKNQREVKKLLPLVARINELEAEYQGLMDEQLIAKTTQFKDRVGKGESLDDHSARGLRGGEECLPPPDRAQAQGARPRAGSDVGDDSVRRAVDRRHGAAFRPHRGNGDGRRQDAGGDVSRPT